MAYSLKVADLYKLLINSSNFLTINGTPATFPAMKFYDGTKWRLVYQIKDKDNNDCLARYYDGTTWQYASVI